MSFDKITLDHLLEVAIVASIEAGEEILRIYNTDFSVLEKEDHSPLTLADQNAHDCIMKHLIPTNISVLSEEGKEIPYHERAHWHSLWIVDPLDGTKEFVKKNGEFTVNIALIEDQVPVLGVIYVPVTKTLFFSHSKIGSFKLENVAKLDSISGYISKAIKLPSLLTSQYTVVASRSHMSEETESHIQTLKNQHGTIDLVSMGSSLKICLVAEGIAHEYPRFAPTMEWDTAAGHAIAKYAGKSFIDYSTNQEMKYNRENLLNPWFIVK